MAQLSTTPVPRPRRSALVCSTRAAWALSAAWLLLAMTGLTILAHADSRPDGASRVTAWPARSRMSLSTTRATALVFVHPQCPCSVATIGELERLVARANEGLALEIVVFVPKEEPEGWRETSLVERARALPGARLIFDVGGTEAALFGATTSGQVLVFEPGGEVVFRGGITGSRGHEGDNDGRSAIEAIAAGRHPLLRDTFVFGCALHAENENDQEKMP